MQFLSSTLTQYLTFASSSFFFLKKKVTMTGTPRTIVGVQMRQTNRVSCIVGATTK